MGLKWQIKTIAKSVLKAVVAYFLLFHSTNITTVHINSHKHQRNKDFSVTVVLATKFNIYSAPYLLIQNQ